MRILLSAFSCGPHRGSEEGVGWNWAIEAARLGHEVIALTQTELQERDRGGDGERPAAADAPFEFFMPPWLDGLQRKGVALGSSS